MTGNPQQAARHFKKNATTIRRWIEHGCPVVRPGGRGPGQAAVLNFAAVAKWRGITGAKSAPVILEDIATAFAECVQYGQVELRTGVTTGQAAALFILTFDRLAKARGRKFTTDSLPVGIHALMHLL